MPSGIYTLLRDAESQHHVLDVGVEDKLFRTLKNSSSVFRGRDHVDILAPKNKRKRFSGVAEVISSLIECFVGIKHKL